ncbi:hypothetical protein [Nocardia abscessus]|uniref:hypothetical protein n=1 Tax=Nocardia abscessus TaxID=120957 RepID=UPI0024589C7D|nr:hypothetical protein [Nocardia abscessus]
MSTHDPGQFARLIANLHAAVTFTDDLVMALAAAMNLRPEDLTELIDHAETLRYHGFARTNGVTSAKVYRGSGPTDNTAPENSAPTYQHSPTPAVPLPRSALPHSPLGPSEPVLISINHAALADCLRNAAWLRTVPTTARGWNLRWRRNTRLIIDGLVAHGGVFSANLPSGLPVTLRYDDLTDPVGVQVWAQTGTDDAPWGVRLATVEYEHGLHYAADTDTQAEAVAAFLTDLLDRLNDDLRAVRLVLTADTTPPTADDPEQRIELVVFRDPDAGTDVDLYIDGRHHDRVVVYHIDPGRGSSDDADQQRAGRDRDLAEASPAACARLRELHSAYPIEQIPPARS